MPAPTNDSPASGATTAPKAATSGNAGGIPAAAPEAASNTLKDTAAPAISLAFVGAGTVVVLVAVVGYVFFIRKKK
jgi:hypothetical protein